MMLRIPPLSTGSRRRALLPSLLAVVLTIASLALPAAAAPGDGGSGGGGGGGQPEDNTGSIYADLVIILRDENGAPILKKYVVPETEESEAETLYCVQPVSYDPVPGLTSETNPVDGREVWVLPLQGEWISDPDPPVAEIEPCDPWPEYAMFVSEVELERLNLARTDEAVLAQKLADVAEKLFLAERIDLGPTGRIHLDDREIDASPENQAMYEELMREGTIPGLRVSDTTVIGPPAAIGPAEFAFGRGNSRFDAWELAAMTIGAAASKSTPLTIDAVEYYNRIIGFPPVEDPEADPPVPPYVSPWDMQFVRSIDPGSEPPVELAGSERFVDYSGFTYNRSQTFGGSITWLDVPSLQWKVSRIVEVVPFTTLAEPDESGTLHGVAAFAQLADDVRALCNFVPDNTFIPGFHMDPPGIDTTTDQQAAIVNPAVDLGTLPENVFQTMPFQVTMSLLNPWGGVDLYTGEHWGGSLIDNARLRITLDADERFTDGDIAAASVATVTDPSWPVPFTVNDDGDLVGWWGPDTGFDVQAGYNRSTTFDVVVSGEAPTGEYAITLELVDLDDDPLVALAMEAGLINVIADVPTVLWGEPLPKLVTQATVMQLPLVVYSPAAGSGTLDLAITGPGDDPVTEALAAGDVSIYGSNGTTMVPMALALDELGRLAGEWDMNLNEDLNAVVWYVKVIDGAPVGNYSFDVILEGGNELETLVVTVAPPPVHGEQPGAFTVALEPVEPLGSDATFEFTAEGDTAGVTFECKLERNGEFWMVHGDEPPATEDDEWRACGSPQAYTDLPAGSWEFFVRGRRGEVVSPVVSATWDVAGDPGDLGTFRVFIEPVAAPSSDATFVLEAEGDTTGMIFECKLEKDSEPWLEQGDEPPATDEEAWKTCQSPKTYTGLPDGSYEFFLRGRKGDLLSTVKSVTWTVPTDPGDPVDPGDPADPGDPGGGGIGGGGIGGSDAPPVVGVTRSQGADRFATAAALSDQFFPDGASVAVVVTGDAYPDAVVAGPLAQHLGGPVLLTHRDTLPAATAVELDRLAPDEVIVVGGEAAVSDAALAAIEELVGRVTRVAGADRYATAAAVSAGYFEPGTDDVFLATGESFPDALAAGAIAGRLGGPVLLVRAAELPAVTAAELDRIEPATVHVVGGTSAIGVGVIDSLRGLTGATVVRHAGDDRYGTAVAVAELFAEPTDVVLVATGRDFPDALSASALGQPLLLVGDTVDDSTMEQVRRLGGGGLVVLGGSAAVSEAVMGQLLP